MSGRRSLTTGRPIGTPDPELCARLSRVHALLENATDPMRQEAERIATLLGVTPDARPPLLY